MSKEEKRGEGGRKQAKQEQPTKLDLVGPVGSQPSLQPPPGRRRAKLGGNTDYTGFPDSECLCRESQLSALSERGKGTTFYHCA